MRLVPDTNVALSALVWRGAPYRLLQAIHRQPDAVQLYSSEALLTELAEVLARPHLAKPLAAIGKTPAGVLADYLAVVEIVVPTEVPRVIADDPDDDHVLACALAAKAFAIVSGDRHLLGLQPHWRGIAMPHRRASGGAHRERSRIGIGRWRSPSLPSACACDAAVIRPIRKTRSASAALQWGRGVMPRKSSAEVLGHRIHRRASMRPRRDAAENLEHCYSSVHPDSGIEPSGSYPEALWALERGRIRASPASMRPRRDAAGNPAVPASKAGGAGFNEAAA